MPDSGVNLAVEAAEIARERIRACIERGHCFLVEAGAGAGKTYSLIETLRFLIAKRGPELMRRHQRIACITYTNVAVDEIATRTDRHPAIQPSTIHSFCWSLIRTFQSPLRSLLPNLENWPERLAEAGPVGQRTVEYDLGHPRVEDDRICLHHNDVLSLTVRLMEEPKFRDILAACYPIVLIDEYQDTDRGFAEALRSHILGSGRGPWLGFFGDHWQRIYGTGCGAIAHPALEVIGKRANFRSVPRIVNFLNRLRPELPQAVQDPNADGYLAVFHTNRWTGNRRTGQHWSGDLPVEVAHAHLAQLREQLASDGWEFTPDKTKILMLTHKVLAAEQGYGTLEQVFPYNDAFIKKEDSHIAFFCDVLEPVSRAYESRRFGDMFSLLGDRTPTIRRHADKVEWARDMNTLLRLRATETVGAVIDHLKQVQRPTLPDAVERRERELENHVADTEEPEPVAILRQLRNAPYQEIIALSRFIDEETPFATKHGVKGAEFDNVLVVLGRGWNQYNFNEFLELAAVPNAVPVDRRDRYERNRNLFYVACSRPRKRLALLFTQQLSNRAIGTLAHLAGPEAILPLVLNP